MYLEKLYKIKNSSSRFRNKVTNFFKFSTEKRDKVFIGHDLHVNMVSSIS